MNSLHIWAPDDGPDLPPEYVARVLGEPRVTVTNARANAEAVENERLEYAKPREQRLCELLRQCLPYVQDAHQGRGDKALEKLIREELR